MRPPWWMRQLGRLFAGDDPRRDPRPVRPKVAPSTPPPGSGPGPGRYRPRIDETRTPWGEAPDLRVLVDVETLQGAFRRDVPLWVRWELQPGGSDGWVSAERVLRAGPWVVVVRNRTEHTWLQREHMVEPLRVVFALVPPSAP